MSVILSTNNLSWMIHEYTTNNDNTKVTFQHQGIVKKPIGFHVSVVGMYLDQLEADDPCHGSIRGAESFMILPDTRKLRAFGFHYTTSSIHVGSGENQVAAQNNPWTSVPDPQSTSQRAWTSPNRNGDAPSSATSSRTRKPGDATRVSSTWGLVNFQGTGGMIKKLGRLIIKV